MSKVYVVYNPKGGSGKTTTSLALGAYLAKLGYKVLVVDCDNSANATMGLGFKQPNEITVTLAELLQDIIDADGRMQNTVLIPKRDYILHAQGLHLIPSCGRLKMMNKLLFSSVGGENMVKKIVDYLKHDYDFIVLDTIAGTNTLTTNALNAGDRVIVPAEPEFFAAKSLEGLLSDIAVIQNTLNEGLAIEGALITKYDNRRKFHRQVKETIANTYGTHIKVFDTVIPDSVRATESQGFGISLYEAFPKAKITLAYATFVKELLANANQEQQHQLGS